MVRTVLGLVVPWYCNGNWYWDWRYWCRAGAGTCDVYSTSLVHAAHVTDTVHVQEQVPG